MGRSSPIAIDNSDNSDDVDVENVEENDSLLTWRDDKGRSSSSRGPIREVDGKTATEAGSMDAAPVSTTDTCLLATILNDLKDITVPKCDPPLNFEARYSPDTRRKRLQDPCEANRARSNQSTWLAETRSPVSDWPAERHSNDQSRRLDRHPAALAPPLLKKASPVRSHDRNTPPPLKHKDAGSPHLSPAGLRSPHVDVDPVDLDPDPPVSHLSPDHQAIPPISTLKKPFISPNKATSCHLAPIDSHLPDQVRALTTDHKSDISSSHGSGNDRSPRLDFMNSLHSPTLHSGHDGTKETSSPVNLHPVNPLSHLAFHSADTGWSKEKRARTDSTSGGYRNETLILNSCQVAAPVDLHLPSSGSMPAGRGVFSGVNSTHNTPPAVLASSFDSRTQYPSSPTDSHPYPSTLNSVPTSDRLSPTDLLPQSHKSTLDLHSSSAASEGPTDANVPTVNHNDRSPPASLHSSRVVATAIDGLSNHTALPHTASTPHRRCSSPAELTVRHSDSKLHNHFADTNSTDSQRESKSSQRDFQLHTDNHMTPFPESDENPWNSTDTHSDSRSPIDERSTSSVLATHTHSATLDTQLKGDEVLKM